jgi:hypothetical protein
MWNSGCKLPTQLPVSVVEIDIGGAEQHVYAEHMT